MFIIKPKQIHTLSIGCPTQFEGMADSGYTLYGRYRGGKLRVYISTKPFLDAYIDCTNKLIDPIIEEKIGDNYDGWMTKESFLIILNKYKLLDCSCLYIRWIKFKGFFTNILIRSEQKRVAKKIFNSFYRKK